MKISILDWYADGMTQADWHDTYPKKKWSPYFILALIAVLIVLLIMWR